MGEGFRTRARRFPGLVNCTAIDWFHPWPRDALKNVAEMKLADLTIEDDNVRKAVVDFMPFSFEAANKLAKKCFMLEKRHIYTTPKSFLELLNAFSAMLNKKYDTLQNDKFVYELGLSRLEETEMKVSEL